MPPFANRPCRGVGPDTTGRVGFMSDQYDPDEKFSLYPLDTEEALRKLLGVEDEDPTDPEDDES